jgi:gas vesicle protein
MARRNRKNIRDMFDERLHPKKQKQEDQAEAGLFFIGAVAGSLIGAVVAMWFAPQSGSETRHEIKERSTEIVDEIEHAATDARRRIEGESVDEAIQMGKAEARRYQEAYNR